MEKTFWNHLDGLTFSSLGMAPLEGEQYTHLSEVGDEGPRP